MASTHTGQEGFESTYGKITDEHVAELRSRVGVPLRAQEFGAPIPVASEEALRLWAWGIGDDNPLYTKVDYGAQSRWKAMLAHPSILLGMDPHRLGYMGGLPGSHSLFAGINWEWFRPIRLNQRVLSKAAIGLVEVKDDSKLARRSVKVRTDTNFTDTEGTPLARFEQYRIRYERREARERGAYTKKVEDIPHQYTEDEVKAVYEQYQREVEQRAGLTPRYIEDVQVGDELPHIIKGPLTITTIVAFTMAVKPVHLARGHRLLYQLFNRHPGVAIPNYFGVPDPPISVHWEHQQAINAGLPTAYDFGMERSCWAAHLLTDWMGDDAFLKALRVRFKAPNYLGDLQTFRGKITEKVQTDGLDLVKVEWAATNQRQVVTTEGTALVALPSRQSGLPAEEALARLTGSLDMI